MAKPTCNDIVTLALRLPGVIGMNAVPTAAEAENGMAVLQGMYDGWATGGMFGRLKDVLVSSDYTANEGERVRAAGGATVTLPTEISDCGDIRAPRDLSLIEIYNVDAGTSAVYLWDRNEWVELNDLELTDPAPLSTRDRAGLAACLAEAYAEMFGGSISAGAAARARNFRAAVILKRGSTQDRQAEESDYY